MCVCVSVLVLVLVLAQTEAFRHSQYSRSKNHSKLEAEKSWKKLRFSSGGESTTNGAISAKSNAQSWLPCSKNCLNSL